MKKTLILFLILLTATYLFAQDVKITELTEDTSPTSDDLVITVNAPGTSPANRKVTLGNAIIKASGLGAGPIIIVGSTMTVVSGVTATELGYVDATSSIQTQLDARCLESVFGTAIGTGLVLDTATLKASTSLQSWHAITAPAVAAAGDVIVGSGANALTVITKGANNTLFGVDNAGTLGFNSSISLGDNVTFYDTDAVTKIFKFDASSITAGQTRVITVPDSNFTIYGTATGSISSSQLLTSLSDETGTGVAVFNNSPTFVDDITLGSATPTGGSAIFYGATSGTITLAPAAAAGTTVLTLPATTGTLAKLENKISDLSASTSLEFIAKISDETGTGLLVFATSPTFTTQITSPKVTNAGNITIDAVNAAADSTITLSNSGATYFANLTVDGSISAGDVTNDNYIRITNNAARAATASVNELYPEANIWKANQNGTEYTIMLSTLATNDFAVANSIWAESNNLVFEGATANDYETRITVTDPTADRTITIPDRTGQVQLASACSAMSGTGGASTLTVGLSNCYTFTVTDNEDTTITASAGGTAGDEITIIFLTAGAANEVITFHGTLIHSTGTLTLDTTADKYYVIRFISNGTAWFEVSRTAVQT